MPARGRIDKIFVDNRSGKPFPVGKVERHFCTARDQFLRPLEAWLQKAHHIIHLDPMVDLDAVFRNEVRHRP